MKASFKAIGMALALSLFTTAAHAGWYSSHGSAPIVDDNVANARRNAIDDALRNIALQSGADVSIEQILQNGTLLSDQLTVKSRSPFRRVTVIEEQENGKVVTVLVKAWIDDNAKSDCLAGTIKKTVLPFVFRYADSDASLTAAGIEDFGTYLSDLIYNGISQSPSINILTPDPTRLIVDTKTSGPDSNIQRTLDSISRRTQAQFIIIGTINSLAKSETSSNAFTKLFTNPTRTIRFRVQIYDVYSGNMIMNKDYMGDAEWAFERGSNFSIRSDKFNTSDYGQRAQQLAKYAIGDIVSALRCQTPYARVIQISDDDIRINLGSNSGIKVGMKFNLVHRTDYQDRHNKTYYQNNVTTATYKVIDVSPAAATLSPDSVDNQLINVMLDDLVMLDK